MSIKIFFSALLVITGSVFSINAQTIVNSLAEFRSAVQNNNQDIVLEAGDYYLEDLPSNSRVINCSGSNNTIDMTGAHIKALVGSIRETYFIVSGDDNVLKNGVIEDYYKSGQSDNITDYSLYNNDGDLSYGLRAQAVMSVRGNDNLIEGLELIVRGSTYGYGSIYGIGRDHTFSLDKRAALNIGSGGINGKGQGNTFDNVTVRQNAFGHGIFVQDGAGETVVKNCYVEGRMRLSAELYNETNSFDYPFRSDYKIAAPGTLFEWPLASPIPIPMDVMYALSEDGIRSYGGTGAITVENCTVKQMRGGIRTYLASKATVTNCTSIGCGLSNFNVNRGGEIIKSSGDFSFAPIMDVPLDRTGQNIELTIIPSPDATGPHNIADIDGGDHNIVFHRTPGPVDSDEERAIVVTGDNSTIVNETEYTIILESSASGNTIVSCGPVIDNGSNNKVSSSGNCEGIDVISNCDSHDALDQIEAEDFCNESGIQTSNNDTAVGYVNDGDWISFENVDFSSGINSVEMHVSSASKGGTIEIREGSTLGPVIGTVEVPVTGDFTTWETVKANISGVTEKHDVYLMFKGGSGFLFDVDWFKFSPLTLSIGDLTYGESNKTLFYPNPVASTTTFENVKDSIITIYSMNSSVVFKQSISSESELIDLSNLTAGIYFVEVRMNGVLNVNKLIKK